MATMSNMQFYTRARLLTGNLTCKLLKPTPTDAPPGVLDMYGLGNTLTSVEEVELPCLYVPQRISLDRVGGVTATSPITLILLDEQRQCTLDMRLVFQGKTYLVLSLRVTPPLSEVQIAPA